MKTPQEPIITEDAPAERSDWHHVWKNCDYATFFHSPDWMDAVCNYSGGGVTSFSRKITFNDGKSVILILSVTKGLKGLMHVYESAPLGVYGGWISTDTLTGKHSELISALLRRKFPNLIWRANPFDPLASTYTNQKGFKTDLTFVVPLKSHPDELFKKFRRNTLRNIRKAEAKNLLWQKIQAHHIPEYYDIYIQAQERWKSKDGLTTRYGIQIFESLFRSDHCDFWGIFDNQKLICAGPILKSKNHTVSWLGLTHNDYLNTGAYEFFYYNIIRHYQEQGYTWFDFNPSSGLKGVEHFKKGFATVELPAPIMDSRSAILKGLQKTGSAVESGIKKLLTFNSTQ